MPTADWQDMQNYMRAMEALHRAVTGGKTAQREAAEAVAVLSKAPGYGIEHEAYKHAVEAHQHGEVAAARAEQAIEAMQAMLKKEECVRVECQNCEWTGPETDCEEIKHLTQRVAPGEPMPVGECPKCGALCHPVEE